MNSPMFKVCESIRIYGDNNSKTGFATYWQDLTERYCPRRKGGGKGSRQRTATPMKELTELL